jgi:hypothetical protein
VRRPARHWVKASVRSQLGLMRENIPPMLLHATVFKTRDLQFPLRGLGDLPQRADSPKNVIMESQLMRLSFSTTNRMALFSCSIFLRSMLPLTSTTATRSRPGRPVVQSQPVSSSITTFLKHLFNRAFLPILITRVMRNGLYSWFVSFLLALNF